MSCNTTLKLPDFFLIGAPKAGTTALYHSLCQHPDIYMPALKEPHYFTFEGQIPVFPGPAGDYFARVAIKRPLEYAALFAGIRDEKIAGEASTTYLGSPVAAKRISKNIPHARIIALLRQPAERAYSQYNFYRFHGVESADTFSQALGEEADKIKNGWSFIHFHRLTSLYFQQLRSYFDVFPRENIKILLHDEWSTHPASILQDTYRFLGVNDNFEADIRHSNVTLLPDTTIDAAKSRKPAVPLPLDPAIRRQLTDAYREDILKTQDLIGLDLSHWLIA